MAADIQEANNLGIYSSTEPYPSWFDDICPCPNGDDCPFADGECFDVGYCIVEKEFSE